MQLQIYVKFLIDVSYFCIFLQYNAHFYKLLEFLSEKWSKIVIAAIASTTGTALGKTHGS